MRKLDLILTGTGRCATGFYAKFLTSAGIQCGHELFFDFHGLERAIKVLSKHWTGTVADSSWLAAPFLNSEPLEDALIIHLVRHPKKVIESWLRVPPSTTPQYDRFRHQHLPTMGKYPDDTIDQYAHVYVEWNRMIEAAAKGRDVIRWTVENEPVDLLHAIGRHYGITVKPPPDLFDNRKYNTKRGYAWDIGLDDIQDPETRAQLVAISQEYGYTWADRTIVVRDRMPVIKAIVTSLDNLDNLKESIPVLLAEPLAEIVVVNNGSQDGTGEWLTTQRVTAVQRDNLGAGPGRNAGLDRAGVCDYFLMLDGGIRPLRGGTLRMLDYLERVGEADVIGVEIPDFETDYEKAWYRWPTPIVNTYRNTRLSHTAYCLARFKAFDGLRFCEAGPFGEPGWGADDDEMAYQWNEAGVVVHVVTRVHPYRRASGSFRRLYQETGVWANQYGSVYEKRVVWLQHHWPQYEPGLQWGEPYLTVIVQADGVDPTARLIKAAHERLRQRRFRDPWAWYPNPYSIVAWGDGSEWWDWAEPRHLRQHHGDVTVVDGEIVRRNGENEATWTGDFRLWPEDDWWAAVREKAHYYGLVRDQTELDRLLARYDQLHPPQPAKNPPAVNRVEIVWPITT